MSAMTVDELYARILQQDPTAKRDGNKITVARGLSLPALKNLPAGVDIAVGGSLDLCSIRTLSGDACLIVGGYLDLSSLTTLAAGVSFSVGGGCYLDSLTTISTGVQLVVSGNIRMFALRTIPANVRLTAGGYISFRSLASLPDDTNFYARWGVYANIPEQIWRGELVKSIDGVLMILRRPRTVAGVQVYAAEYFGSNGRTCYVAIDGKYTAHGESVREAVEDVRFKQMRADPSGVVHTVKTSGVITREQYRAMTGACRFGVAEWCEQRGIPDDVESLPLDKVLEMTGNDYGGDRLKELLEV